MECGLLGICSYYWYLGKTYAMSLQFLIKAGRFRLFIHSVRFWVQHRSGCCRHRDTNRVAGGKRTCWLVQQPHAEQVGKDLQTAWIESETPPTSLHVYLSNPSPTLQSAKNSKPSIGLVATQILEYFNSLNPPILHGGLENAASFQCLAPHHGVFLFQKDSVRWYQLIQKKEREQT